MRILEFKTKYTFKDIMNDLKKSNPNVVGTLEQLIVDFFWFTDFSINGGINYEIKVTYRSDDAIYLMTAAFKHDRRCNFKNAIRSLSDELTFREDTESYNLFLNPNVIILTGGDKFYDNDNDNDTFHYEPLEQSRIEIKDKTVLHLNGRHKTSSIQILGKNQQEFIIISLIFDSRYIIEFDFSSDMQLYQTHFGQKPYIGLVHTHFDPILTDYIKIKYDDVIIYHIRLKIEYNFNSIIKSILNGLVSAELYKIIKLLMKFRHEPRIMNVGVYYYNKTKRIKYICDDLRNTIFIDLYLHPFLYGSQKTYLFLIKNGSSTIKFRYCDSYTDDDVIQERIVLDKEIIHLLDTVTFENINNDFIAILV